MTTIGRHGEGALFCTDSREALDNAFLEGYLRLDDGTVLREHGALNQCGRLPFCPVRITGTQTD